MGIEGKRMGVGITDFLDAVKESKDPREQAYRDLVKYLFEEEKLMMVTRLSEEYGHMIVRNYVLIDFYQNWYRKAKVEIHLFPHDDPPFYRREVKMHFDEEIQEQAYENLIKNIMKVKISEGGKGREETLKILRASDEEIEKKRSLRAIVGGANQYN